MPRSRQVPSRGIAETSGLRRRTPGLRRLLSACVCGALTLTGIATGIAPLSAQPPPDPTGAAPRAAADVVRDLVGAHRDYERSRRLYASADWFGRSGGGYCDEIVGRMCLRMGAAGDWWFPEERPERMIESLDEFLDRLRAGAEAVPDDPWILGNLVFYLGERGLWHEAVDRVTPCPLRDATWCAMLRGTALHAQGRYDEAASSFERGLDGMDPTIRTGWLDPGKVAGSDLRDHLDTLPPAARAEAVSAWWRFSDPFFLVEGNDRWTEHLARRTVNAIRDGGPSAYRLRYGDDLEEITLRFGWEIGWERIPPDIGELMIDSRIVGHQHPYSLPHVAPDEAVLDLAATTWEDWNPQSDLRPRTGYAPAYAPNVLPAGDVLVFPRGGEAVVAGLIGMPEDTSRHANHDHPPLPILKPFARRGVVSGLFVAGPDGSIVASDSIAHPQVIGATPEEARDLMPDPGGMAAAVPPGSWIVSVEHWSPEELRGARIRRGLEVVDNPPDLLTLSDLVVLEAGPEPETLEEALPRLRAFELRAGTETLVGWEVFGLGSTTETLRYRLVLEPAPGGFLRRAGAWLGLVSDDPKAELEWTEDGPAVPGPHFRSVGLTLPPELEPGRYLLRLELEATGRSPVLVRREIVVR